MKFTNALPEIATEFNNEELRKAAEQNCIGSWYFIITHINSRMIPEPMISKIDGPYEQARVKAGKWARSHGCVDGIDSILVVFFSGN